MTEERSCKTCGLSSSNNVTVKLCQYLGETCNDYNYFSKWQPIAQEKPMEKVQMTEEQAMCLYRMAGDGHVEFIKRLKQAGLIRKTAMEEAEEYEKHFARIMGLGLSCTIKDLEYSMRIIERLKSEIERLKG
jgi:hypothetical protein